MQVGNLQVISILRLLVHIIILLLQIIIFILGIIVSLPFLEHHLCRLSSSSLLSLHWLGRNLRSAVIDWSVRERRRGLLHSRACSKIETPLLACRRTSPAGTIVDGAIRTLGIARGNAHVAFLAELETQPTTVRWCVDDTLAILEACLFGTGRVGDALVSIHVRPHGAFGIRNGNALARDTIVAAPLGAFRLLAADADTLDEGSPGRAHGGALAAVTLGVHVSFPTLGCFAGNTSLSAVHILRPGRTHRVEPGDAASLLVESKVFAALGTFWRDALVVASADKRRRASWRLVANAI